MGIRGVLVGVAGVATLVLAPVSLAAGSAAGLAAVHLLGGSADAGVDHQVVPPTEPAVPAIDDTDAEAEADSDLPEPEPDTKRKRRKRKRKKGR